MESLIVNGNVMTKIMQPANKYIIIIDILSLRTERFIFNEYHLDINVVAPQFGEELYKYLTKNIATTEQYFSIIRWMMCYKIIAENSDMDELLALNIEALNAVYSRLKEDIPYEDSKLSFEVSDEASDEFQQIKALINETVEPVDIADLINFKFYETRIKFLHLDNEFGLKDAMFFKWYQILDQCYLSDDANVIPVLDDFYQELVDY